MNYVRPDPVLVSVKDACRVGGFGRTVAYKLARAGRIDMRKIGRKTVVTAESLDRFAQSLPRLHGDDAL